LPEADFIAPAIRDRVILEATVEARRLDLEATVANVTSEEVWVGVEEVHAPDLPRIADVPIILMRAEGAPAWADTRVRRLVGTGGCVAALWKPSAWTTDPRRANGRVELRLPAYLRSAPDQAIASAWMTNVSVGGFQCSTGEPLLLGQRVDVSLALSPVTTLDCWAQVVRISEDPEDKSGRRMLVAFQFLELEDSDQEQVAAAMVALDSTGTSLF
jgi:hypothetical protein